jgi:hypothetical protein
LENNVVPKREYSDHEIEGRSKLDEIGLEQVRLALQTKELPVNDIGITRRWMRDKEGEIADRQRRFDFCCAIATVIGAVAAVMAAVVSLWLLFR